MRIVYCENKCNEILRGLSNEAKKAKRQGVYIS